MISIRQQSYGLNVALFNEFTVEDFKLLEQSVADVLQEHEQPDLLLDLSLNLRGMISQRLMPRQGTKGRIAALEVLLNTPLVSDLIAKGDVVEIKEIMQKSRELGMQTFDQALFDLFEAGSITYEDALRNADSVNNLRLQIKLHSQRAKSDLMAGTENFKVM